MARTVKINIYDDLRKKQKDLLWQKRVYKKDDMREYRKLANEFNKLFYTKNGSDKKRRYHSLRSVLSAQQNCVVKLHIGKDAVTHQRFIKEYLSQESKNQILEKPKLFNEDFVNDAFLEKYSESMTGKHFKFIISPESTRVDTRALVKTLIKRMEKITGYSFLWMAATHTDTNHPHAHLLINGKDTKGKDIYFDRLFISQTMRELSRQICTEMIGKRSREEIRTSLLQSHKNNRYSVLDDAIHEQEEPLETPFGSFYSQVAIQTNPLEKRILHLCDLGLAEKKKGMATIYYLEKEWGQKLRAIGRYNSFLQARSQLKSVLASNLELYTKDTGEVSGKIMKLYKMNDEDSWNNGILVENSSVNKAWYIPLYFEPNDDLFHSTIVCAIKKNQKGSLVPRIIVKQWDSETRIKNQNNKLM